MNVVYNATTIPSALMYAARTSRTCSAGSSATASPARVDREIGDLIGTGARGAVGDKLFTYIRYGADIGLHGLADLGLGHVDPVKVQKMEFDRGPARDARSWPDDRRAEGPDGGFRTLPWAE